MAKRCLVCGKGLGALSQKMRVADGLVCLDCWKQTGFGTSVRDVERASTYTGNDIKNIISGTVANPAQMATDLESAIAAAIKASGTSTVMQKGSIKDAAFMIRTDETVIAALAANVSLGEPQGMIEVNTMSIKNKMAGVVVVTNQRVIFAASSGFKSSKSIYLTDINAIDDSSVGALFGCVLRIQTTSTVLAIDGIKQTLDPFRNKLEEAAYNAREAKEQKNNNVVIQQAASGADEILKYKGLLDAGIITEEEFNAKKAQILGL